VPDVDRPGVKDEALRRVAEAAGPEGALAFDQDLRYTLGSRRG